MSNEEVLEKTQQKVILRIRKSQLKFWRYIVRKEDLENVTLIRHVEGKADRERQRITYLTILVGRTCIRKHG